MVLGSVMSLGIASLSWYLFESQILKLKGRLEHRQHTDSPGCRLTAELTTLGQSSRLITSLAGATWFS
jgi:peptidoglycan/LPS O-acetylase OafA/YrhL